MGKKDQNDHYSAEETRNRFEAALRGAREVGHTPMKSIPPKRPKKQRRSRKTITTSA
jgi:hypothetical protein